MELGNLLFGNSRGAYPVPRDDDWQNCFSTLLRLIDGPNYDGYGTEFVSEVFELHRYYWGDCTCGGEDTGSHKPSCPIIRPNFAYAPTGFSLKWYKYPFRDAYMSQPLAFEEFRAIINDCIAWLRDHPHAISTCAHTRSSGTRSISARTSR